MDKKQKNSLKIQGILFCRGGWINSFRSLGQNGDEFTLIHRNIILNFVLIRIGCMRTEPKQLIISKFKAETNVRRRMAQLNNLH